MHLRVTEAVHLIVGGVLQPGDLAVDATAGNGHDTVFLATAVGQRGRVVAFDVQKRAIDRTAERLRSTDLRERVNLLQEPHEHMDRHVDPGTEAAGAVMFNLGYLPGEPDRTVKTTPSSTTSALRTAIGLLRPLGVVSVVCYRGHDGGPEESEAVLDLAGALDPKRFTVSTYRVESAHEKSPFAVFIQNTA